MKEDKGKTKEQLIGELTEMRRLIAKQKSVDEIREKMDTDLQIAFDALEIVMKERNLGLQKINQKLVKEINKRKRMETALRESETQLRRLSAQLFNAQEEERRRLSKELHDQLGHDLVLLKSRFNTIKQELPLEQVTLHKELTSAGDYVEQIIDDVRRIATELSPIILEDLGLVASIQWLVENFAHQHSLKISLNMEDIDRLFIKETRINLYRIFQESLTNISKHAQAKKVFIAVTKKDHNVIFRIKDDGKGFDLNSLNEKEAVKTGMGLAAMKERVNLSGGNFKIKSILGKGTIICFKIPMQVKGESK